MNAYIEWYIRAPSHYGIWADFDELDVISFCTGCNCDFVDVYDGNSFSDLSKLATFCNRERTGSFFTFKRHLKVIFSSSLRSASGKGFKLTLKNGMGQENSLIISLCPPPPPPLSLSLSLSLRPSACLPACLYLSITLYIYIYIYIYWRGGESFQGIQF